MGEKLVELEENWPTASKTCLASVVTTPDSEPAEEEVTTEAFREALSHVQS